MLKKPPLVIFDIDGTIADISNRVHFIEGPEKDWDSFYSNCDRDARIPKMLLLYNMVRTRALVGFMTGRPNKYRQKTTDWLYSNGFDDYQFLFMREDGNHDPDWYIKKKAWVQEFSQYYDLQFVVEDRKRVVDMWRDMGILCLQCDEGKF